MKSKLLSLLKNVFTSRKIKLSEYPENFSSSVLENLRQIEKLLGYKIKDPTYYIKALTHRSYNEFSLLNLRSNERLEYLGDSVLNMVTAEYLFKFYPDEEEGFLTKTRAKMVNRVALADAAERINLIGYMFVNNSILSASNGIATIIADAMEALVGAIYIDSGLATAKKFIEEVIIKPSVKDNVVMIDRNYKSQLLEFSQAKKLDNPFYKIINEEGPNHAKTFTVEVFINHLSYGVGTGRNKKEAEQNAANEALTRMLNGRMEEGTL